MFGSLQESNRGTDKSESNECPGDVNGALYEQKRQQFVWVGGEGTGESFIRRGNLSRASEDVMNTRNGKKAFQVRARQEQRRRAVQSMVESAG